MSGVRSAAALRRLYERYRTAPLKASAKEWLVVEPGSEDAQTFEAAFGGGAGEPPSVALNGALKILHALDIRVAWKKAPRKKPGLAVRFFLAHSSQTSGRRNKQPELPRSALPPTDVENLSLDFGEAPVVPEVLPETTPEITEEGVELTMPDGSPLPDLSGLFYIDELIEAGFVVDLDSVSTYFTPYEALTEAADDEDETRELLEAMDVDIDSMLEGIRTKAELSSGLPPISTVDDNPRDTWEKISESVVSWVKNAVRALRETASIGHMLVLAPSPGTGKSRGMMQAADEEQNAKRTVGYAVLSRAQLSETAARLKENDRVRLIIIEGRNEQNCYNFDQVTVATTAGFSPGATVCPGCEFYPRFGQKYSKFSRRDDVCPYYGARLDAIDDRKKSSPDRGYMRQAPAIILTTHASAIMGSHITEKRNQSFWNFDTLFIDEDPTGSMVAQYDIAMETLTYHQVDQRGNIDGPTRGTMLLRDAMKEALRQRQLATERGFVDANGDPDRIHSREHGSTFAGGALHALLESTAQNTQNMNLLSVGSSTIDGLTTLVPGKGEIMNLSAAEVAARFPNRYLAPLFATLEEESVALAGRSSKPVEPAYRVHLDLIPVEGEAPRAVIRLHLLRGYANGKTNIVIGDAYADVPHYESLFDRRQRDGKVQVIKHRALWPASSTLIRIVARSGTKQISNTTQLIDHCEMHVRPILELERGRKIVFYVHRAMKTNLREWLESEREELELGEFEIEHWGSGRGKDTYKDFHTFIAVSEYVPNMGALVHEANTVSSLADVNNNRVAHWNGYAPRRGSMGFANSLTGANPFFQGVFHRKATDELAQAVHRIRPAIPAPDGQQKRAYVIGHMVPWSDELIAATAATAVVDKGKEDVDLETEALGRGARFSMTETLGLVSAREVAGAIGEVFRALQCWSNAFTHALVSVPSWEMIEDLLVRGRTDDSGRVAEGMKRGLLKNYSPSSEVIHASSLADRVLTPPPAWATIVRRIQETSAIYRAGVSLFLAELTHTSRRYRATWMGQGSRGYEYWGDKDRFEQILNNYYAPGAQKVPF